MNTQRPILNQDSLTPALRRRIDAMPPAEQRLLRLRFQGGLSFRKLALLEAEHISSMHRRFARLLRQLNDPILAELHRCRGDFEPWHWQLAVRSLVVHQGLHRICDEMKLDAQTAAEAVAAAKAWYAARQAGLAAAPVAATVPASRQQWPSDPRGSSHQPWQLQQQAAPLPPSATSHTRHSQKEVRHDRA